MSDALLPAVIVSQPERAIASPTRVAIARASQATGVDFGYLLAQAKLESSLDPAARATRSSAAGLFQFTSGTWTDMLAKHGAEHGLGVFATRAQALAARFDPEASSMMAAELARDNIGALTGTLGHAPDNAELYLAHFLGIGGAKRFLATLASDPDLSAAALLPDAAAANPTTFYAADGSARSVSQTMALLRTRLAAASEDATVGGDMPLATTSYIADGGSAALDALSVATSMDLAQPAPATLPHLVQAASMSDVLASTFGVGAAADASGSTQTPAFVRTAYAKLQAMGL